MPVIFKKRGMSLLAIFIFLGIIILALIGTFTFGSSQWCSYSYLWQTRVIQLSGEGVDFPSEDYSGIWYQWYGNGNIKSKTHYLNGVEHGVVENYYSNGNIRERLIYHHGELDGEWKAWFIDGTIHFIQEYKLGVKDGKRFYQYPNGSKMLVEHYKNGELNGMCETYYPSGKLESKGIFKEGIAVGDWVNQ